MTHLENLILYVITSRDVCDVDLWRLAVNALPDSSQLREKISMQLRAWEILQNAQRELSLFAGSLHETHTQPSPEAPTRLASDENLPITKSSAPIPESAHSKYQPLSPTEY